MRESEESTTGVSEPAVILSELNKLAKHGFDFFLAGIGLLLFITCVTVHPESVVSESELLLGAASGVLCIAGGIAVNMQKRYFAAKANQETLAYNRFVDEQNTLRMRISASAPKLKPIDLPK